MKAYKIIRGLLAVLASFSLNAYAKDPIEYLPAEPALRTSFFELVEIRDKSAAPFLDLFRKGLARRFKDRPEVLSLTRELAALPLSSEATRISVQWEDTRATIRKAFEDRRMRYTVEDIYAVENGQKLPTGQRVVKPNTSFARILTAVTEAFRLEILQHPDLALLELQAGVVVNPVLLGTLKNLGFQLIPNLKFNQPMESYGDILGQRPGQRYMHPAMFAMERPDLNSLRLLMNFGGPSMSEMNPDLGRSLYLTLNVKR